MKSEVLEEIEESRAFFQVYEGAVYMNRGKTYLVKHLDLSSKIAWCQEAELNYYTKTRDYTDVHVIGSHIAVWIRVPQSLKTAVETLHYSFRGGLHAAGHAILNAVPLFIICNQSNLASECAIPHDARYVPERILLYNLHPGGTGISAKVQPLFTELLTAALELLTSCHCSGNTGCPNCVQNTACREYNEVLHKDAAVIIIKGVLAEEQSSTSNKMLSFAEHDRSIFKLTHLLSLRKML